MFNLSDVAREAGVSPGTVSNALSGKRPVAEKTRQRIFATIERLGYQPNLLARSLAMGRTNTVAVVITGFEAEGPLWIASGVEIEAGKYDFSLLLDIVKPDHPNPLEPLQDLINRRVDGIIWAVQEFGDSHSWVSRLRAIPCPPIVFLYTPPRAGVSRVWVDHSAGSAQAAGHLVARGYRRIGHVSGPQDYYFARERLRGWKQVVEESGLPAHRVIESDFSARGGAQAMADMLERWRDVDAVYFANDTMALGALYTLEEHGIKVPDDVAIIGFDDRREAPYYRPALTTVRQDFLEVGRAAMRCLLELLNSPDAAPIERVIVPELVIRESCR